MTCFGTRRAKNAHKQHMFFLRVSYEKEHYCQTVHSDIRSSALCLALTLTHCARCDFFSRSQILHTLPFGFVNAATYFCAILVKVLGEIRSMEVKDTPQAHVESRQLRRRCARLLVRLSGGQASGVGRALDRALIGGLASSSELASPGRDRTLPPLSLIHI